MIVNVMSITFAQLKNDTLRLARQVQGGSPSKIQIAETPEFVVFVLPLLCRVYDAYSQCMPLQKVDMEIVEHGTNINVALLTFDKGAR